MLEVKVGLELCFIQMVFYPNSFLNHLYLSLAFPLPLLSPPCVRIYMINMTQLTHH